MAYRQKFGKSGENAAAEFLINNGFTIIEQNVRCGRIGEIDLVASKDNLMIFVEVKTRSTSAFGGALYSISNKKKLSMKRSTEWYLLSRKLHNKERMFRLDFIAVENEEITWVQDILR